MINIKEFFEKLHGDNVEFFLTTRCPIGVMEDTLGYERYNDKYGYVPDDVGALTWDALGIVQRALQDYGKVTGNTKKDRQGIRDALAQIKEFDGITGQMTFTEEGDPIKCAVVVRISDAGEFEFYKSVCP